MTQHAFTTAAMVGLKSIVVLGMVALVDRVALRRLTSAGIRHLLWSAAIVGALLLPIGEAVLPSIRIAVSTPAVAGDTPRAERSGPTRAVRSGPSELGINDLPHARQQLADERGRASIAMPAASTVLLAVYLLGVAIVLARLFLDRRAIRSLLSATAPVDAAWMASVAGVARRMRLPRGLRVLQTELLIPPITFGVLRPTIVVPRAGETWDAERREAALLHELAHAIRRDCLTQLLAAVACALYWPNPLVWFAANRLRIERELACDDLVIAHGLRSLDYASHLLEIARSLTVGSSIRVLAVSMATPTNFEARLRAILDDLHSRLAPRRSHVGTIGAAMLALAAPLSVVTVAAAKPVVVNPPRAVETRSIAENPKPKIETQQTKTSAKRVNDRPATRDVRASASAALSTSGPARKGEFTIRLLQAAAPDHPTGVVQLALFHAGITNTSYDLGRFSGLTAEQLSATSGDLRFALRNEVGDFEFFGSMQGREGQGRFEFTPDAAYSAEIRRRGIGDLTVDEQFGLTLHPLPLRILDVLAELDFPAPTTEDLVLMAPTAISEQLIRDLRARGSRKTSDVVRTAMAFQRRLPTSASGRDVADREPQRIPPGNESPVTGHWNTTSRGNGAVTLHINWADNNQWSRPLDVNEMHSTPSGFRLPGEAGDFEFTGSLSGGLGSGEFVFTPKPQFANTLRAAGIRNLGEVTTHDLKNLGFSGVTESYLRQLAELGWKSLTKSQLMSLAVFQVSPDYVRGMQTAGVEGADSVEVIVELRVSGVPVDLARRLAQLGVRPISREQLMGQFRYRR